MDNYAAAKAKLFAVARRRRRRGRSTPTTAGRGFMERDCQARIIRFGFGKDADYRARDIAITSQRKQLHPASRPTAAAEVSMGLIGRHNIENALLAAALVGETFGLSVHQIAAGLERCPGAAGPAAGGAGRAAVRGAGRLRPHGRCAWKTSCRPCAR